MLQRQFGHSSELKTKCKLLKGDWSQPFSSCYKIFRYAIDKLSQFPDRHTAFETWFSKNRLFHNISFPVDVPLRKILFCSEKLIAPAY